MVILKGKSFLQLRDPFGPIHIYYPGIGRNVAVHALAFNGEVEHIVVRLQCVDKVEVRLPVSRCHTERHAFPVLGHHGKEVIAGNKLPLLGVYCKSQMGVLGTI